MVHKLMRTIKNLEVWHKTSWLFRNYFEEA